jgi:hypothetical protein
MSTAFLAQRLYRSLGTEAAARRAGGIREGDTVVADDGILGQVEHVARSEAEEPVYLVVRVGRLLRRRYPVVPIAVVTRVDSGRRIVEVRGHRDDVRRLPEALPLVL